MERSIFGVGKRAAVLVAALWLGGVAIMAGQGAATGKTPGTVGAGGFDAAAGAALEAMRQQAVAMKVDGVALLSYSEGEKVQSWTSRMLVVGTMKKEPTETNKGANLLAVVYSKAAEMADTLKDSGSAGRAPLNGELGYRGGLIVPYKAGYLMVAFSGGKTEEDLTIARVGVATMAGLK